MTITLLQGDCREVLATLPEKSVQCCVTSPPYFGLRRYDVEGAQIGSEPTPAEYVAALVEVFRQVRRVLRDDGTCWINIGDSYSTRPNGSIGATTLQGSTSPHAQYRIANALRSNGAPGGLQHKDLMGIPWRVAFALQDDGWILRSDIIWHKPNPMPESVTDRPTRAHEYLFLFAKQPRYYYDAAAIAEQSTQHAQGTRGAAIDHKLPPETNNGRNGSTLKDADRTTRNKRTVWSISTRPFSGAHFAVFPEQLIEPCILAGSAAQACEHCGAPWERHIEKKTHSLPVEERNGRQSHNGTPPQQSGWFWQPPEVTDLGFRPTCRCENTGAARSIVLDPFVGSGTTCRVAERYGRNSIGIDLGYQDLQEKRTDGVQISMEAYL